MPWGLWGGEFNDGELGGRAGRVVALVRALPALPAAAPSWWRADAELAGAGESMDALAARFGGRLQWIAEPQQPGQIEIGSPIERMTVPVWRISLLSNQGLRQQRMQPRNTVHDWDPSVDLNCPGWEGGFSHGDTGNAIYQRNQIARQAPSGPQTLFRLWSSRPLPAGPARWTRQAFKLDREATGFTGGELRTVDLDADGKVDVAWVQLTGLGPGHLERPHQDDAWYRLLLVNVAGRWRLLATDQFSYGCGC